MVKSKKKNLITLSDWTPINNILQFHIKGFLNSLTFMFKVRDICVSLLKTRLMTCKSIPISYNSKLVKVCNNVNNEKNLTFLMIKVQRDAEDVSTSNSRSELMMLSSHRSDSDPQSLPFRKDVGRGGGGL